jgi:hypothetical protein
VLVYSFAAFLACYNALFGIPFIGNCLPVLKDLRRLPVVTIRILVESCLLSAIAMPMGVYSKLSQFASALVGIALVAIALRDPLISRPGPNYEKHMLTNWRAWLWATVVGQAPTGVPAVVMLLDRVFRLSVVGVLAPAILFPVFVTSSIEYRGSAILVFPSIVFTLMVGSTLIHTRADPPDVLTKTSFRQESRVVQPCLFLALTILLKPLIFPPTA